MRLVNYKNNYLILSYLLVFFILGIFSFYIIEFFLYEDARGKLNSRKDYVVHQLSKSDSIYTYQYFSRNIFEIRPASYDFIVNKKPEYSDTIISDPLNKEHISYRQMRFYFTTSQNKSYEIYVRRASTEWEGIVQAVVSIMSVLFILVLISLFFAQRWVIQKTWTPFYHILSKMQKYNIGKIDKLELPESNIREFNELQTILNEMIEQLYKNYLLLKEFTENISHEIQTPLAVIKSKLELISHNRNIDEEQITLINDCFNSINKLSKLNEALVLLARIENREYLEENSVVFTDIIQSKLEYYKDLIAIKEIDVDLITKGHFVKKMHYTLADILVGNLIVNAIKHNIVGGIIRIEQSNNKIVFFNTGEELTTDPKELFQRFFKVNSNSLGLGLAIVKQICEKNNIEINYTYTASKHTITLTF